MPRGSDGLYDYTQLKKTAEALPHTVFGQSVLHRNLYLLTLGQGPVKILLHAAHHGLEQITTEVLMRFYWELREGLLRKEEKYLAMAERLTLDFVPMVNPDGVELALHGLSGDHPYYYDLKRMLGGRSPSEVWQANIRGVDLNHNYDAGFERSKALLSAVGITEAGPTRYAGPSPESEPESHALAELTRQRDYDMTLSFHAQGEVIYYGYMNYTPPEAEEIGRALADASGYGLEKAEGVAALGGYKDWFTKAFRRPGYTIEVGRGKNPLPPTDLEGIYQKLRPLFFTLPTLTYQSKDRSDT